MGVELSSGFSIKEAVEVIEARIPFGRLVASVTISLLLLAVLVFTGTYLWHAFVWPLVTLLLSLFTRVQIAPATLPGVIGSLFAGTMYFVAYRYGHRVILNDYMKVATGLQTVGDGIRGFTEKLETMTDDVRTVSTQINALEGRVAALEESRQSPSDDATRASYEAMMKFADNEPLTEQEYHDLSALTLIDKTRGFNPANTRWAKSQAEMARNLVFYRSLPKNR